MILRMISTNSLAAFTRDVSGAAGLGSVAPVRPAAAPSKSATPQRLLDSVPPAPAVPLPRGSLLDLRVQETLVAGLASRPPAPDHVHMQGFARVRHEGDDRDRLTCRDCGYVAYENPKVVVGSVVEIGGEVLLCRRAIEPRSGYWTLPAGYMELGETVEEGARREAREEACAEIALDGILGVFSIARLGQVQIIFRARLARPGFAAGPESREVRPFAWADIPWDEIAFPSVRWALGAWHDGLGHPGPPVRNPPEDARGTRPLPGPPTEVAL